MQVSWPAILMEAWLDIAHEIHEGGSGTHGSTCNSFNDKTFLQASQLCNSSMAVADTLKTFMIQSVGDFCWEMEGLRSTMVEWTVEQGYGQDNIQNNFKNQIDKNDEQKPIFWSGGGGARWARKNEKNGQLVHLINEQSCQILSFVFACMYNPRTKKNERGLSAAKPTATQHERRRNKSGARGDFQVGEVEEEGVRVVVDERGQDEERLGETRATKGFAFPQHLRKIKRNKRRRRTTQQQKERGQTTIEFTGVEF